MEISKIKESTEQLNFFLSNTPHFIFHTLEYKKFIEEAFETEYILLAAQDGEKIKTILPVVKIKSKLFGNKMISSAYLEYGGFAGEEEGVGEILDFIGKGNSKYGYLEIRGGEECFDEILSAKLIKKNLYKRFVLELGPEEKVWKGIQHSKRKAINRALRNVEVKEVPLAGLDEFYKLYLRNMKRFGSPPYAKKYFESFYRNIVDVGQGKIYGAYIKDEKSLSTSGLQQDTQCFEGKLVAALLGFCYRDRIHIVIAVSDERFREHRPNDAVHWEFIKWGCEKDYKWFDFGRVREESGQFEYKRKWGPKLLGLPSYFMLWGKKEIPEVDPSGYGLAVKMWKKMPLWFTKLVGPRLRKELGI